MTIDYTQFFNPAAVSWGSWAPPARGMVAPSIVNSPLAPAPAGNIGAIPAAPTSGAAPAPVALPRPMTASPPPAMGQAPPVAGAAAAAPLPPQVTAQASGTGNGQGWNALLQKAAMMVNPQAPTPPPIGMAKPVGPGAGLGQMTGMLNSRMLGG